MDSMKPLDYGRSFLIGKASWNQVRFWVESRTRVIDEESGRTEDYYQAASCKSEDTFAERDLFREDNYDFLPVFGPEFGVIFRRQAWLNPNYRTCVPSADLWEGQEYHLIAADTWTELRSARAIIESTQRHAPLVAQTELCDVHTRLRVIIEYPVKTMNTDSSQESYQVDTGPVAFVDPSIRGGRAVDRLALAFVAFNAPDFADFVLESPTPLVVDGQHAADVHHYSERVSFEAENRLYALV